MIVNGNGIESCKVEQSILGRFDPAQVESGSDSEVADASL